MSTSNESNDGSAKSDKKREEVIQEKPPPPILKCEWPLFLNPNLVQLQVTGYEIYNGIVVSACSIMIECIHYVPSILQWLLACQGSNGRFSRVMMSSSCFIDRYV